ncbi:GTPase [Candidatus Photodesmus blepharus]|uniref:GTPase Der n=1 Tax=Candidatus Photodesmus blepharonis TaxID=1179155 RepID=A0A084CPF4_9GAMM
MVPVVALVGRSNVGKSTLFNRLTNTRDALVADFPGLTRDRQYGRAEFGEHRFIVVDTGGVDSKGSMETKIAEQSFIAINEADIVLFMVDVRSGLMVEDKEILQRLRRIGKRVMLVANKVDGVNVEVAITEFCQLGLQNIYPISASQSHGIEKLVDSLSSLFIKECQESQLENLQQDQPIKLAVIGRPNVGKSTLINRILGEDRVVVCDLPGTTRDSIYIPMCYNGCKYILIDTAGVRRRKCVNEIVERFSVIKTLKAVESANVVLFIIDAYESISDQDLSLLGFTLNTGCSIVIVMNKWDTLNTDMKKHVKRELERRLRFVNFVRIHFISALHRTGLTSLFKSVREAYEVATTRVGTASLTRIMKMAIDNHRLPMVRGRRVKLKYAHAGGYNPPIIVIHGNLVDTIPLSYKRYLMNYYRKSLNIVGTPIRVQFKNSKNPFNVRASK